jgi:hypothetical protein
MRIRRSCCVHIHGQVWRNGKEPAFIYAAHYRCLGSPIFSRVLHLRLTRRSHKRHNNDWEWLTWIIHSESIHIYRMPRNLHIIIASWYLLGRFEKSTPFILSFTVLKVVVIVAFVASSGFPHWWLKQVYLRSLMSESAVETSLGRFKIPRSINLIGR